MALLMLAVVLLKVILIVGQTAVEGEPCNVVQDECDVHHICDQTSLFCRRMTCIELRNMTLRIIEEFRAMGEPIMGASPPSCDTNGTYERVQCSGSACLCVTRNGDIIKHYMSNIWEKGNITCHCARTEHEYSLMGMTHRCSMNGNYERVQCLGSMCYCVDALNGQQLGTSVPISDVHTLVCGKIIPY